MVTTMYVKIRRMSKTTESVPTRRYRGASKAERQAERKAKLLEAGIQVIGSQGYQATTVKAVCTEAGLTERYFYESFSNKEALLCGAYIEITTQLRQRISRAALKETASFEDMITAAVTAFFTVMQEEPEASRLIMTEVLGVSDTVDQLYRNTMHNFSEMILTMAAPYAGEQSLEALDQEMIATGLTGAITNMAIRWILTDYAKPIDVMVKTSLQLFTAVGTLLNTPDT